MDGRSIELFTELPELRGECEPDRSLHCPKQEADDRSEWSEAADLEISWRRSRRSFPDGPSAEWWNYDPPEKMAAGNLTKSMRPKTLTHVMAGEWMDLTPIKNNECEKNNYMVHWRPNPSCRISSHGPFYFAHPCRMAQVPRHLPQWKQVLGNCTCLLFTCVFGHQFCNFYYL